MKRHLAAGAAALALFATPASTAFANAGSPGTTFPEQPGSHTQRGCNALGTNPGTGPGGPALPNALGTPAGRIVIGVYTDACGPA
jgi:hypothetical protein